MSGQKYKIAIVLTVAALFSGACSSGSKFAETAKASEVVAVNETDPETQAALAYIAKAPDAALGYRQLAIVYIKRARRTGDFSLNSNAEDAIKKALQVAPDDIDAQKLQATLHLTFHRFQEALELGSKLVADNPNDAYVYGLLTDANVELGNYDAGVAAVQKMVDLRPNSSSYARVAHVRSLKGDHVGAVEMYKLAARTADPQDREAQSWCLVQLGDEYLRNGNFPAAGKAYDEALSNFPDYDLALAGKGKALAASQNYPEAASFLLKAQTKVPHLNTVILLGDVYARLGDAAAAKRQYDIAQGGEAQLGAMHDAHRVALFWADHDTNLDEALAIARADRAVQNDIYAADTLAWCYYKKGMLAEARAESREAMRLNTNDAKLYYHAGMIERALGDRVAARKLISKALKLNPQFDLIQADTARQVLGDLG